MEFLADRVITDLKETASSERAESNEWFFKTGKGQYGYGDKFLGVRVPEMRKVAKKYKELKFTEIKKLISNPFHEVRLTGVFILVYAYQHSDSKGKKEIFEFYMSHTKFINNWDLVDSSAGYIVGDYLQDKADKMSTLTKLAKSKLLWERRIAMIATLKYIVDGSHEEAIAIATILLNDDHDLIQKAVGWMLREVGKRVDRHILLEFLDEYAVTMPRTTLRYAIEHLKPEARKRYLQMAKKV